MTSNNSNPWKTISSKKIYDNPWISVFHDDVINPGGGSGIYGTVHFKNLAIGIVPLDDEDHTWLVGQFRYPLRAFSWEIPEGGGPLDIDPLESAKRELREETGLVAANWEPVVHAELSNSVSDERAVIYLATGLTQKEPCPEESEELTLKRMRFSDAVDMVYNGEITDAMAMLGLMRVDRLLRERQGREPC